jgi:hypothetical protein
LQRGINSPTGGEYFLNRSEIGQGSIGIKYCYYMVIHFPHLGICLAGKYERRHD